MKSRATIVVGAGVLGIIVLYVLLTFPTLERVECLRAGPWNDLKTVTSIGRLGIWVPYMVMPVALVTIWWRVRALVPAGLLARYGAFILACGMTHLVGFLVFFGPYYWIAAKLEIVTAAISIAVMVETIARRQQILNLVASGAALATKTSEAEAAAEALERKNAELILVVADRDAQIAIADLQRRTIQGLSVPILQIGRGMVLIPIIGVLDSERAAHLSAALLNEVEQGRAETTLLDLTGVETVDTATAKHMIDLVRAVGLMGGAVMVTGIRPAVAQTMTSLGIDLGVKTFRTIEKGLEEVRP